MQNLQLIWEQCIYTLGRQRQIQLSPVPSQHHSPHPVLHKEESARPTISLPRRPSFLPLPLLLHLFRSLVPAAAERRREAITAHRPEPARAARGGHREGHVTEAAAEIDYNVDHENRIVVLWLGSADGASSCLN